MSRNDQIFHHAGAHDAQAEETKRRRGGINVLALEVVRNFREINRRSFLQIKDKLVSILTQMLKPNRINN